MLHVRVAGDDGIVGVDGGAAAEGGLDEARGTGACTACAAAGAARACTG